MQRNPLRVLVVDDNADAADTLALLLRLAGHEARPAHGGAAALQAVADYRPGVVLLDLGLPDLDGFEVARRLRAQPQTGGLRLVALTGSAAEEDRERTRAAGFEAHLLKPVEFAELWALLGPPPARA